MNAKKSIWRRDIGLWLAFGSLVLLYAFLIVLFQAGVRLRSDVVIGVTGWTGVLFALAWRKLGRSGWAGFFIGVAFAVAFVPLLAFLVSTYRAMS